MSPRNDVANETRFNRKSMDKTTSGNIVSVEFYFSITFLFQRRAAIGVYDWPGARSAHRRNCIAGFGTDVSASVHKWTRPRNSKADKRAALAVQAVKNTNPIEIDAIARLIVFYRAEEPGILTRSFLFPVSLFNVATRLALDMLLVTVSSASISFRSIPSDYYSGLLF